MWTTDYGGQGVEAGKKLRGTAVAQAKNANSLVQGGGGVVMGWG